MFWVSLLATSLAIAQGCSAAPHLLEHSGSSQQVLDVPLKHNDQKVNVTLYGMSRCPDARICETVFDEVLRYSGIQEKINLKLDFIAHVNSSERTGFTCKHGQSECHGNIHDLCLQSHLPLSQWYPAMSCQNFQSPFPGSIGNISLTRRCAEASKVDWWASGVGECILGKSAREDNGKKAIESGRLGKEGKRLLGESVERANKAEATKSCTIDIGQSGKRRCVVDDGVWTGCDDGHAASDFVRVIEEEWKALQKGK